MPTLALIGTDVLIFAAVFAGVCGFMALVMLAIAHLSGWRKIAPRYPAQPPTPDAAKGLGSIEFAPFCGYNNCIRWHADDDYLHLRLMPPFNIFHPPMSIPWIDISDIKTTWTAARLALPDRTWKVNKRMVQRELKNRELLARSPVTKS